MTNPRDYGDNVPSDLDDTPPPDFSTDFSEGGAFIPKIPKSSPLVPPAGEFNPDLGVPPKYAQTRHVWFGDVMTEYEDEADPDGRYRTYQVQRQDGKIVKAKHWHQPDEEIQVKRVALIAGRKLDEFIIIANTFHEYTEPCWDCGFEARINATSDVSSTLTALDTEVDCKYDDVSYDKCDVAFLHAPSGSGTGEIELKASGNGVLYFSHGVKPYSTPSYNNKVQHEAYIRTDGPWLSIKQLMATTEHWSAWGADHGMDSFYRSRQMWLPKGAKLKGTAEIIATSGGSPDQLEFVSAQDDHKATCYMGVHYHCRPDFTDYGAILAKNGLLNRPRLLGYYRCEETSSTTLYDSSGNSYNLTGGSISASSDRIEGSWSLHMNSSSGTFANTSISQYLMNPPLTIAFWWHHVYGSADNKVIRLYDPLAAHTYRWYFEIRCSWACDDIRFGINDAAITPWVDMQHESWNFITLQWFPDGRIRLRVQSQEHPRESWTQLDNLAMEMDKEPQQSLNAASTQLQVVPGVLNDVFGRLDGLGFWGNRMLTPNELKWLYASNLGRRVK